MEKILKILIVFALLMIVIVYSVYSREKKFRDFYFVRKMAIPPQGSAYWDLPAVSIAPEPMQWEGEESIVEQVADRQARDEENGLVFHATGASVRILDGDRGEEVARISLEEEVDALLFDPAGRLLYCCSIEGRLNIIRQSNRETYKPVQQIEVPIGCSRMTLDAAGGNLFLQSGTSLLLYRRE